MNRLPLFNEPISKDQLDFDEYIGNGVAHRPVAKRMKLSDEGDKRQSTSRADKPAQEVEPVSKDVFEPDSEGSTDDYVTAPEDSGDSLEETQTAQDKTFTQPMDNTGEYTEDVKEGEEEIVEEEEEEEEEDEVIYDSQESNDKATRNSSVTSNQTEYSEELNNSYVDDLYATMTSDQMCWRGPEGSAKIEVVRSKPDDLEDVEMEEGKEPSPGPQDSGTDTASMMKSTESLTSTSHATEKKQMVSSSVKNQLNKSVDPFESSSSGRTSPSGSNEKVTGETSTPSSSEQSSSFLSGKIKKHVNSATTLSNKMESPKVRLSTEKLSHLNITKTPQSRVPSNLERTPRMEFSSPVSTTSASSSSKVRNERNDNEGQSPRVSSSSRRSSSSDSMRQYKDVLEEQLRFFQTETRPQFKPILDARNVKEDFIYRKLDEFQMDLEPNDFSECPQQDIETDVLLDQPWQEYNSEGKKNKRYKFEKTHLENYLKEYKDGGYHLFFGLMERMLGMTEKQKLHIPALEKYFDEECKLIKEGEVIEKFANVVRLALTAYEELPKKIYRLVDNVKSATFSQAQCAAILAQQFFRRQGLATIFVYNDKVCVEKIRFLMEYFSSVTNSMPIGNVSFRRVVGSSQHALKALKESNEPLIARVVPGFTIEESALSTQVDFANKSLGGGVLRRGAVQEEIRFLMCPEMIVGMWLFGDMKPNEAISIVGAQCFSSYTGYARNLCWVKLKPQHNRQNNKDWRDKYGRLRTECIAIDALCFPGTRDYARKAQFKQDNIIREVCKAYYGFSAQSALKKIPIVTGWWGCGAFNGNKALKYLIQLVAAAAAGRQIIFCPFDDKEMGVSCQRLTHLMKIHNFTAKQLYAALLKIPIPPQSYDEKYALSFIRQELLRQIKN